MRSMVMVSVCGVVGLLSTGCSMLFVESTPPNASKLPTSEPLECTTSRAAPTVDLVMTGLQVLRTAYAASESDGAYRSVPISRGADIGLGIGLTAAYGASMIYGYSETRDCREAKDARARRRRRERERERKKREAPMTAPASSEPSWKWTPPPRPSAPLVEEPLDEEGEPARPSAPPVEGPTEEAPTPDEDAP